MCVLPDEHGPAQPTPNRGILQARCGQHDGICNRCRYSIGGRCWRLPVDNRGCNGRRALQRCPTRMQTSLHGQPIALFTYLIFRIQITCKSCGVCPHEFRCDCPDALRHSWACKHCHLLAMMFGCRESGDAGTDVQLQAVEEAAGIVESLEETVDAPAEFESIDGDECNTAEPARRTLEDRPEMAAASRAMRQSLEKFDEMLILSIPASFNEQQHETTLSLVSMGVKY
jgi:hypothetical protein